MATMTYDPLNVEQRKAFQEQIDEEFVRLYKKVRYPGVLLPHEAQDKEQLHRACLLITAESCGPTSMKGRLFLAALRERLQQLGYQPPLTIDFRVEPQEFLLQFQEVFTDVYLTVVKHGLITEEEYEHGSYLLARCCTVIAAEFFGPNTPEGRRLKNALVYRLNVLRHEF